jgi:hypothetical protein
MLMAPSGVLLSPVAMRAPLPRKLALTDQHRRALSLLGKSPNGISEALMQARGVPSAVIEALIAAGQVTIATMDRNAGGRGGGRASAADYGRGPAGDLTKKSPASGFGRLAGEISFIWMEKWPSLARGPRSR